MDEANPIRPLKIDLTCSCGGCLYIEAPKQSTDGYATGIELLKLATAWVKAHEACLAKAVGE